jgi:hypothetical protein
MKPTGQKPSDQINEALAEKIRAARADGRSVGKTSVEAATPSGKVTVVVEDADRLGVLAGPVTARKEDGRPSSVKSQAQETTRKITYLQEPLAIIETEEQRGRAILRSAEPRQTGGAREYNEAILEGGDSISIHRYRSEPGKRRRAIPSNLSRETLGRLADDLPEILDKE